MCRTNAGICPGDLPRPGRDVSAETPFVLPPRSLRRPARISGGVPGPARPSGHGPVLAQHAHQRQTPGRAPVTCDRLGFALLREQLLMLFVALLLDADAVPIDQVRATVPVALTAPPGSGRKTTNSRAVVSAPVRAGGARRSRPARARSGHQGSLGEARMPQRHPLVGIQDPVDRAVADGMAADPPAAADGVHDESERSSSPSHRGPAGGRGPARRGCPDR